MNDTVFLVTTVDGDIENKPDVFHYLGDAREYLISCLERRGIDLDNCEYKEYTDVDGMEHQIWRDEDNNGYVTTGTIDELELR